MRGKAHHLGFSLIEVLLAVGTLAIGMLFIAGTFLAGVHFTTIATERTIAAVAADEAFAKIKLYGVNPNDPNLLVGNLRPFEIVDLIDIGPEEYGYPSTRTNPLEKQYYWSALCRRIDPNLVQVIVFVSRKTAASARYRHPDDPLNINISLPYPVPVYVNVTSPGSNILDIEVGKEAFINDGYTIVDDRTGQIYRVLERDAGKPDRIILDKPWLGGPAGLVWVVPPSFTGGRGPCIAVYPKEIRF